MKQLLKELLLYGSLMVFVSYSFNVLFLKYAGYETGITKYLLEYFS